MPDGLQNVLVIGDWGTGGSLQKKVARSMNAWADSHGIPKAVVSVGDNIYPSGVSGANDPQWKTKFENIYDLEHLKDLSWIAVLGNHDYRGSVDGQIQYGKLNKRWIMPSAYFVSPCPGAETLVTFFCLDTQAILQRNDGLKEQLQWLDKALSHGTTPWKIVVGHHPMRSYGHYKDQAWMLEHVKPLLEKHGVAAYLCGHDHDLQIIQNPADRFTCIVSGGGGGCRTTTWGKHTKAAGAHGGFCTLEFNQHSLYTRMIDASGSELGAVRISGT